MKIVLLTLLLISPIALAKHLGNFGQTFDILEDDLLEVIQSKLRKLELEGLTWSHQEKIQKEMLKKIQRPTSVQDITKTTHARVYFFDPSISVPYDLKDHNDRTFLNAGTIINPLKLHSLSKVLVFIDGDDNEQVSWATAQKDQKQKIILVKGSPFDLMDKYNFPFYFDQGGSLVKKLGIKQVPTRVSQENHMLKIEEILLSESKE